MANVSIVLLLVLVVFGILGVQMFNGRFYSCNDTSVAGRQECVGSFVDPESGKEVPREWTNAFLNFDHLGNALLSLFVTVGRGVTVKHYDR